MNIKLNELIKVTLPIVKPILRKSWKRLLFPLAVVSIFLGFFPTIKSGVEANFINEANQIFNEAPTTITYDPQSGKPKTTKHYEWGDLMSRPFGDHGAKDADFFERLPNLITYGNIIPIIIPLYLALMIICFLLDFYSEKLKYTFSQQIFVRVRETAFSRILNLNPSEVPEGMNTAGSYANSVQTGTEFITSIYEFIGDIFQYAFALITAMLVLFSSNWLFALFFLLTLLLQVTISRIRAKRLKKKRNELEEQRNNLAGRTDDILSKKEIILAFEQSERYTDKISFLSGRYGTHVKDIGIKSAWYAGISKLIFDTERILIPLLILIFLVYNTLGDISSGGSIFFLVTLYSRLSIPILNILRQYDELKSKEATTASLIALLAKPTPAKRKQEIFSNESTELKDAVTFKDVNFFYRKDKVVFNNVTFNIPRDKTTFILGPSGSGKSSIAKILLGFWPIQGGTINLMGYPLDSYSDEEIRKFSSYISQNDFITEETVRENLSWGTNSSGAITDEMMMEALNKVSLVDDVDDLFFLNKLAKSLSGGEQQRLSLARVILDEAPLLILDEPLTGVDVYTIMDIMPHFNKALKSNDRTVVLISHKLSFANCADHIIILNEHGEIIEEGAPKELIKHPLSKFNKIYTAAKSELIISV